MSLCAGAKKRALLGPQRGPGWLQVRRVSALNLGHFTSFSRDSTPYTYIPINPIDPETLFWMPLVKRHEGSKKKRIPILLKVGG